MHVALRRNGEVLPPLSHIFAAMGRPYAVRAIPPECPQGKENCNTYKKALKMNVILIFCIFNLQLQVLANLQVAFVKVMK